MKKLAILIFSLLLLGKAHAQNADSIIKLPVTFKPGFGPFPPSYAAMGWDDTNPNNPWYKTYLPIKGIPADWTDVKKGMVFFDIRQFVYQNYITGSISNERYLELQQSWNWTADTTKLSKKPLACFAYVISGKNKNGQRMMVVDAQGDLDVSNDIPFLPGKFNMHKPMEAQPEESIHQVNHQALQDGKIITLTSPLLLLNDSLHTWYSIPQYAVATLTSGNTSYEINIASNFTSDDLSQASIILMGQKMGKPMSIKMDAIVNKYEYVTIDHKIYRNKGVVNGMLNLQFVTDTANMYSTQLGYKAIPFKGKQFDTGKEISLTDLKGKYVFVDFWGTWCGPCRAELPNLKKAYDSVDKNKVAFIGVVNDDTYKSLKPVLDKEGITWPQIISVTDNNIAALYNINVYPSNFLIDPQGRIIAKNLRGSKALNAKLKELVK